MRVTQFRPVPVQIVGQSYEHRSPAISVQKTENLIPMREVTGAAEATLTTRPGTVTFCSLSGRNRGMTDFAGTLYKVNDTTLYSISSAGVATSIGTIAGSSRCVFANDGTNLIITTGSTGYIYNGTTLASITDTDYQNANSVSYLNQKMFYDGNGGRFQVSDVGDPDSVDSLNIATAESAPDDTIRVYTFKQTVFVFGEKTVEPWYDTGSGNPPVGRINQGIMAIGLHAIHSVDSSEDYCYFLGSDKRVYRFSAYQPENITTNAMAYQIDLNDWSDAVGTVAKIEGQTLYILTSETAGQTFVYSETVGAWVDFTTGEDSNRFPVEDFVDLYGKKLVSWNGDVRYFDRDVFTDNSDTFIQERVLGPVLPQDLGIGGSLAMMSRLWLHMQSGIGLISGQGENPIVMCSISTDGGESWSSERNVFLGRMGDSSRRPKYDYLKSFGSLYIKIRCSDPVFISIFGGTLEVRQAGI